MNDLDKKIKALENELKKIADKGFYLSNWEMGLKINILELKVDKILEILKKREANEKKKS